MEVPALNIQPVPTVLDPNAPTCPLCGATAIRNERAAAVMETIQHDCDCDVKDTARYHDAMRKVYQREQARKDFLTALPSRYRAYTFDVLRVHSGNAQAVQEARALQPGENLYLWGPPGNGKTHLAVALGHKFASTHRVTLWGVAALFGALREAIGGKGHKPDLMRPDVLILDDLGKIKPTEYAYEVLYATLEARWADQKTTICTANHKASTIAGRLTPDEESAAAVLSRLVSGRWAEIKGADERIGGKQ